MRRALSAALTLVVLALPAAGRALTFPCPAGEASCTALIPDANRGTPGVLTSGVTVVGCSVVDAATVAVSITHDYVGDLTIRLTSPAGTAVKLVERSGLGTIPPAGCASDDVAATFADGGAGPGCGALIPALSGAVLPAEPLAALAGQPGEGLWQLEITDALHAGTGALDGWSLELTCRELCENCLDDDGDGLADSADPDCPFADGGGAGLGDAQRGKAAARCQRALIAGGGRFAIKRTGRLQRCLGRALACVQQKPGDAGCLAKAGSRCGGDLAAIDRERTKLTSLVAGVCGGVAAADLLGPTGLGFESAVASCAAAGVGSVDSAAAVAACVRSREECGMDALLAFQVPRAAELLTLVGRTPATELPCLVAASDGGGAGLGDAPRAKTAVRCQKGVAVAGARYVGAELVSVGRCAAAVYDCVAQDGGDPCLARARRTCAKAQTKIGRAQGKLTAAVQRCPAGALPDVLAAAGLGFGDLGTACADLGVASVASLGDVATCVGAAHTCRSRHLVEAQTPRLPELLGLGQAALP